MFVIRSLTVLFFSLLTLFVPYRSSAKFVHYKLNNGLNIYLEEDHSLPIVNVTILYRVGCVDEYNSITGISHMLEHMNFRGSKHYKDGFIDRLTMRYGGVDNAETSFDYTVYFTTIAKRALKEVLGFYADNMDNLLLDKDKFLKERSVVYQERLWRIDNSADGFLYFTLHNIAYKASPYRWTPIGFSYDIKHYTLSDLKNYYKKYYAPNNAVLVVSGDINQQETYSLIKRVFGYKKPKTIVRHITLEPKQLGRRIAYIKKPSEFKKIAIAFKIPPVRDTKDSAVLDLITYILFEGKTALAQNDLVRKKHVLVDIGGFNESRYYDKGLYEIFASLPEKESFEKARRYIWEELDKLKKGDFSHEILKVAKEKAKIDYLLSKETLMERNMNEAYYAAFGLLDYYRNYLDIIDDITKKDIKAAAQRYFKETDETDVYLKPAKGGKIVPNLKYKGSIR